MARACHWYSLPYFPVKTNIQVDYLIVRLTEWHFERFSNERKLLTN